MASLAQSPHEIRLTRCVVRGMQLPVSVQPGLPVLQAQGVPLKALGLVGMREYSI